MSVVLIDVREGAYLAAGVLTSRPACTRYRAGSLQRHSVGKEQVRVVVKLDISSPEGCPG
jgi:hypothetical protein